MLVSQHTGRRTKVWSPPVISPDGRHFVCGNSDVLARYEPSGLQVWEVQGQSLRLMRGVCIATCTLIDHAQGESGD